MTAQSKASGAAADDAVCETLWRLCSEAKVMAVAERAIDGVVEETFASKSVRSQVVCGSKNSVSRIMYEARRLFLPRWYCQD